MKKITAIIMAGLMATVIQAQTPAVPQVFSPVGWELRPGDTEWHPVNVNEPEGVLPVGTIRFNMRDPDHEILLPDNVVVTVISEVLDNGVWTTTGSCNTQVNTNPAVHGFFLWTYAAIGQGNLFPVKGLVVADARPYGTWWFGLTPPARGFEVRNGSQTIKVLALNTGGAVPAQSAFAWGTIYAVKVAL
jgi:hypothetical protein